MGDAGGRLRQRQDRSRARDGPHQRHEPGVGHVGRPPQVGDQPARLLLGPGHDDGGHHAGAAGQPAAQVATRRRSAAQVVRQLLRPDRGHWALMIRMVISGIAHQAASQTVRELDRAPAAPPQHRVHDRDHQQRQGTSS